MTFPPDGPLRQLSIQQMRLLRDRARFKPQKGDRRVFLVDHLDRANEQAANSLLKTLEEPPDHLVLLLTAENAYDLLPTIRSRAVTLYLAPLAEEEMRRFLASRDLDQAGRRVALAAGCPGVAAALDLAEYDRRRNAMLTMLQAASGETSFQAWAERADSVASRKDDKLDGYLKTLYGLLADLLAIREGSDTLRNTEVRGELERLAILHTGAEARAKEFLNMVMEKAIRSMPREILMVNVTPTIGTHVGPNGLGFASVMK